MDRDTVANAIQHLRTQGIPRPPVRKILAITGGNVADVVRHRKDILGPEHEDEPESPQTLRQAVAEAITTLKSWGVDPSLERISQYTERSADEVAPILHSLLTGEPTLLERQVDEALFATFQDDYRTYQQRTAEQQACLEALRQAEAARRASYERLRQSAAAVGRDVGAITYPELPGQLHQKWLEETAALCAREPGAVPQQTTARPGMIAVRVLKPFGIYFPPDVAGFPLDQAEKLVARGFAEVVTP
jgi:hypothetical protein